MLAKEEGAFTRRIWAYVLTGIVAALLAAGSALAFVYERYELGAIMAALFVVAILCLAAEIVQDNFYQKCESLFSERKFEEEYALLEKIKSKHLLFPFMREHYYLIAARNALARDELALAKAYIDRLRHGDDRSLKYKTAYATVLILLDEGNVNAARAEFEDFRIHNEHYAIYKTQLEVLESLIARLFSKHDLPLPAAAVDSPYPVVKRILGRHFEEASTREEWGE